MNEHERYLFDLRGYLVIPNALSKDEVATLNTLWDQNMHNAPLTPPGARLQSWRFLLKWGKPFVNLIDHPSILPHIEAMCSEKVRLDHEYAQLIRPGGTALGTDLHGGATPYSTIFSYHYSDGRMHNGLIAVAFNLTDVNPGDGGFGCVPGSHKSSLPLPAEWHSLDTPPDWLERVTGAAGTAIIFTEALVHGTLPWTASHERRTLFYKYSPPVSSWAREYYNADDYEGLSEKQRAMMEAPNARYAPRR